MEAGIVLTKSLTRKIEDELYRWKKFMALNAVGMGVLNSVYSGLLAVLKELMLDEILP